MTVRSRFRLISMLLLVTVSFHVSITSAIPAPDRPTPKEWEQWQPEIDDADIRLAQARVSIWVHEATVSDVLSTLGEDADIDLVVDDTLAGIRLTLFIQDRPLESVMVLLSRLLDAYWAFPRGQMPHERSYCLTLYGDSYTPLNDLQESLADEYKRTTAALARPIREERLALYENALALSPSELLELYEESDPWVCANLLDPALRPMIEEICTLDEAEKEELLSTGEKAFPLRIFGRDFRGHLARWMHGEWGRPANAMPTPDVDRLPKFASPDERWDNATVRLWWSDHCLQLLLEVPDVARFDAWPIRLPQQPYMARHKLATLGYREDTPEYRAAAEAEGVKWQEEHNEQHSLYSGQEIAETMGISPPATSDPRLASHVFFGDIEGSFVSAAETFERFALECDLSIIANYQPPDRVRLRLRPDSDGMVTLESVLTEIRRQIGFYFSWSFGGDFLVASNAAYRLEEASTLPDGTLDTWREKLQPGSSFTLDELVSLITSLNGPQIDHLLETFPVLMDLQNISIYDLQLYGMLQPVQRAELANKEGLRFEKLDQEQKDAIVSYAQSKRPWLATYDFQNTVLRSIPRHLSTGEAGISLVVEYNLPQCPSDRDIVFTAPLQITVPGGGGPRT